MSDNNDRDKMKGLMQEAASALAANQISNVTEKIEASAPEGGAIDAPVNPITKGMTTATLATNKDVEVNSKAEIASEPTTDGSVFQNDDSSWNSILTSELDSLNLATSTDKSPEFNFNVDINDIFVEENSSEFILDSVASEVFAKKVATQSVICPHSSYIAQMRGIRLNERGLLLGSSDNIIDQSLKNFRVIYDLIQEMSIPKPTFDTWMRNTAWTDLDTLYYGIYSQSYKKSATFDITCPHTNCNTENKVDIDVNSIISAKDDETFSKLDHIVRNSHSIEDVKQHSLITKIFKQVLPETKIILEYRIPSLQDFVDMLQDLGKNFSNEEILRRILLIKRVLVPNHKRSVQEGRAIFNAVSDRKAIFSILKNLGEDDTEAFDKSTTEVYDKYQLSYQIPQLSCSSCKKPIGPIPLDFENLLFQRLAGRVKTN